MSPPRTSIIDYGVGNVGSIARMFQRAGASVEFVNSAAGVLAADRLILPGVGSFDACRAALGEREGVVEAIMEKATFKQCPLLGICVGMQLLGSRSEEGKTEGLGIIPGHARRFSFNGLTDATGLKVPHMGWAIVAPCSTSRIFSSQSAVCRRFYFVHSYHVVCEDSSDVAAWASYGSPFVAAVERANIFGVQFHPEKSHKFGLQLFSRFLEL